MFIVMFSLSRLHSLFSLHCKMLTKIFTHAKSFVNDFLSRSGIHGFSYLGDMFVIHVVEKLFWLCLICTGIYFSFTFSMESWDRYLHKSTVVSVERDYYYWNTSLPSITTCPMERLSRKKYEEYAR